MFISAFGPYIFMSIGVRLEHLVIYLLLIYVFLNDEFLVNNNNIFLITLLLLLLLLLVPFSGLVLVGKSISHGIVSSTKGANSLVISQIENYLQPLAVIIICFSILHKQNYNQIEQGLFKILRLFLLLMTIHTILAFFMMLYPEFLFWRHFTGDNLIVTEDPLLVGKTAAEIARIGGRISGVFTQVFEAGYAYSVALISWAYLYNKYRKFMKFQSVILFIILIGGFVVSSKIFIFFGVGLFIVLFNNKKLLFLWSLIGLIILLIYNLLDLNIAMFDKNLLYAERLFHVNPDILFQYYTGSRFSAESKIMIGINEVLKTSPLIGFGYGSIATSDFALYEVLAIGGLLGLFFYMSLFILFLYLTFFIRDKQTKNYYLSLIITTIFGSLAAPLVTANRISVIFWIIWSFIITMTIFKSKLKRA